MLRYACVAVTATFALIAALALTTSSDEASATAKAPKADRLTVSEIGACKDAALPNLGRICQAHVLVEAARNKNTTSTTMDRAAGFATTVLTKSTSIE